jgi:polyisoprenoid-binding protein YceI
MVVYGEEITQLLLIKLIHMKLKQILAISTIFVSLSFSANWKVDTTKSKIDFTVKGIFGTVHGSFTGLEATILFNEKNLSASSMFASIDAKTVSTGISLRNSDLRNKEEWLNTEKYPKISFKSKNFEKTGDGYKVLGDLTIKGITKPVEIPFTFTNKDGAGLFKGQFTVSRTEFNLGKPGGSVGSIVTIMLAVPAQMITQ